jgi:hydroxymethylbilane synthase
MTSETVILATRNSPLALWQAETTAARLRAAFPGLNVTLLEVKTVGDRVLDRPIAAVGSQGVFTVEVDRAVQEGRAHAAVHSLKDLATTDAEGLALGAVLARGPAEDVLVSPRHRTLDLLPRDAVVATGSLRRRAMLLRERPDLRFVDARGNIATRLAKLDAGECAGMVLARAGLERLGLAARVTETFSVERLLPAVGQALVGITCRVDDAATRAKLAAIADPLGLACGRAERALLRTLRGGCHAPVGGHATIRDGALRLRARVLSADGAREIEDEATGAVEGAEALGVALAERMIGRGAAALLAEGRS